MYYLFWIYIAAVILAILGLTIYEELEDRRYNKWLEEITRVKNPDSRRNKSN